MTDRDDAERAFSALYRETSTDVLAFLLRRCPIAEDAADCLAETYLIAWGKHDRIPVGAQARPWLFGVARNVMRRGRERNDRTDATTQKLVRAARDLARVLEPPTAPPPDGSAETLSDPLTAALGSLPAIDWEILSLIACEELSPQEAAIASDVAAVSPSAHSPVCVSRVGTRRSEGGVDFTGRECPAGAPAGAGVRAWGG